MGASLQPAHAVALRTGRMLRAGRHKYGGDSHGCPCCVQANVWTGQSSSTPVAHYDGETDMVPLLNANPSWTGQPSSWANLQSTLMSQCIHAFQGSFPE